MCSALSVIISIITAALVYFALNSLFVQPMMRITRNMLRFSQNPEDASRIIVPSQRQDEIGTAERELAHMQGELTQTLQQKSRLAALGPGREQDQPRPAQHAGQRAAHFRSPAQPARSDGAALRAEADRLARPGHQLLARARCASAARRRPPPRRELTPLRPLVAEVGDGLGLPREDVIAWAIEMDEALRVDADRDQLFRVLSNLCRNALQAIEQQDVAKGQHPRDGDAATAGA